MTATTFTPDAPQTQMPLAPATARKAAPAHGPLAGTLHQYHGMRVLDIDGRPAGYVDWIWTDGGSTHIGFSLRWLLGTARAVPAQHLVIDPDRGTIQVAYRKAQMARAPRFAITRQISPDGKVSIRSHYLSSPVSAPATRLARVRAA